MSHAQLHIDNTQRDDDMPTIISSRRETNDLRTVSDYDRWANVTWAAMRWMVILLNLAVGLAFSIDLLYGVYDYTKHVTTIVTMCSSYFALAWIHKNILKDD